MSEFAAVSLHLLCAAELCTYRVSVILYLDENAQEFIVVHIPKKNNTGDNPSDKKNGRTTFFLGATPMYRDCYTRLRHGV